MRIAVASKSGRDVDQHFGHAERFLVFEVEKGESRQLETVEVDRYCVFDPENPTRQNLLEKTIASLAGCRAVVTAMIGEAPKVELKKAGIAAICSVGPIDEALRKAVHTLSDCSCSSAAEP